MKNSFHGVWGRWMRHSLLFILILYVSSPAYAVYERDPAYSGVWQDYGNGWAYVYTAPNDTALWINGSGARLGYQYTPGQWWDYGAGGWNSLGASNVSSQFIGDGNFHALGNGWTYLYFSSSDTALWFNVNGSRFGYQYTPGQWWDYGAGGWNSLGATNVSNQFVGDGNAHDLGNGWTYLYAGLSETGLWSNVNGSRFGYQYLAGQWWDYGIGGWSPLGSTGVSNQFIGDGRNCDVGNGWSYLYVASNDAALWQNGTSIRLGYHYGPGQWWNYSDFGGWQLLGDVGASNAFVGDGQLHLVYSNAQGNWSFRYMGSYSEWTGASIDYRYYYDTGQWKVLDNTDTAWGDLGGAGQPVSCMYADLGRQVAGVIHPYWLAWYNDAVYFSGYDDVHGQELWRWDGTQATLIADINKGVDGSHPEYNSNPGYLTVYNGKLYFSAVDGLGFNYSNLFVYDGSTVTELHNPAFTDVDHGAPRPNPESVNNLIVFKDRLYFSENFGVYSYGIYGYDGTTFTRYGGDYNVQGPVVAIDFGPSFTIFNDALYFHGSYKYEVTPSAQRALFKFDGTNITAVGGSDIVYLKRLLVHNGNLYFMSTDRAGAHGYELYKCSSSDEVSRVVDLNTGNPPGSDPGASSYPGMLTAFNGLLYFTANDGIHGGKLYSYYDTSETFTRIDEPAVGMWTAEEPFTVYNGTMVCETGGADLYMYNGTNWFLIGKSGSNAGWYDYPRHYALLNGHYFYMGGDGKLWQWQ